MNQQELKNVLELHRKWVLNKSDGVRANLSSADLSYANLSSADLSYANLSSANLSYANLSSANLSSANLRSANLRSANLSSANLSSADLKEIMEDYLKILSIAKAEVSGLYKSLLDGKISGSQYQGECACLVGTIANIRQENYECLNIDLKPNSERLSEKWFLAIQKGDTPENNSVSEITKQWTEDFMKANDIMIPKRTVIWS